MEEKNQNQDRLMIAGIIATVVGVIFLCIFFWIKKDNEQPEKSEHVQTEYNHMDDMMTELNEIANYLIQVDDTIVSNQDSLDSISDSNDAFEVQTQKLIQNIVKVEKQLEQLAASFESGHEEIQTSLGEIVEELKETREKITQSEAGLSKEIKAVKDLVDKSYKALAGLIERVRSHGEEEKEELAEQLIQIEKMLAKLVIDEMENMQAYITQENSNIQINIDESVVGLSEKMYQLREEIQAAHMEVNDLITNMDDLAEERQEEIRESFLELCNYIAQIKQDFDSTHKEIKTLLAEIKTVSEKNHEQLIITLSEIDKSMQTSNSLYINQLLEIMNQMNENYNESIFYLQNEINDNFLNIGSNVNNQFTQITDYLDSQFNVVSDSINYQYDNLSILVNAGDDGLRDYLEDIFGSVEQKLESVFTSASSGKKLLASALLAKGVSCKEDATFKELENAILAVPQKIVIGVEQIPGDISYDYHYHINAGGGYPHTEQYATQGGCYTRPIYHVHKDSCYRLQTTNCNCSGYVQGDFLGYHSIDGWPMWKCKNCSHGNWQHNADRKCTSSSSGNVLICGKTNSSAEFYTPSCGFYDGQIIGAHIVYVHKKNAMNMMDLSQQSEADRELETEEIIPDDEMEVDKSKEEENEDIQLPTVSGNIPSVEVAGSEVMERK